MNGEEMSSASILMNLPAAAPAAPSALVAQAGTGAEQAMAGVGGFGQAMAAVQLGAAGASQSRGAAPLSMEMVAALLSGTAMADEGEPVEATAESSAGPASADRVASAPDASAAAILAQMLLGSTAAAPAATPADAPVEAQPGLPSTADAVQADAPDAATSRRVGEVHGAQPDSGVAARPDPATEEFPVASMAVAEMENAVEPDVVAAQSPAASAPQAGASTQALVQAAAVALRDAAPQASPTAPAHTLREPMGTARWADELGNRLVLMSVRGQQQGSLTLTPEHLGPVEVQISVSKDTANVWFGAAHADTRAALSEAMPRLRELLAASGLSLGQSGVSEQAPRGAFAPPAPQPGGIGSRADAEVVGEVTAPAWRAWRPGLLDTYA